MLLVAENITYTLNKLYPPKENAGTKISEEVSGPAYQKHSGHPSEVLSFKRVMEIMRVTRND